MVAGRRLDVGKGSAAKRQAGEEGQDKAIFHAGAEK
jgi:hypothetical protein